MRRASVSHRSRLIRTKFCTFGLQGVSHIPRAINEAPVCQSKHHIQRSIPHLGVRYFLLAFTFSSDHTLGRIDGYTKDKKLFIARAV